MCDDLRATLAELRGRGVEVARNVSDQDRGLLAAIRLPDGSEFPFMNPGTRRLCKTDANAHFRRPAGNSERTGKPQVASPPNTGAGKTMTTVANGASVEDKS
jgi:hypothetical protein